MARSKKKRDLNPGVTNKKTPHWNQERRFRGKIGYGRLSGETTRKKALKLAADEREEGFDAHVKKEIASSNRELYYVWTTRIKGGKRRRRK